MAADGVAVALTDRVALVPHEQLTERVGTSPGTFAVIEPERIPFISYPFEWAAGQLKAAALATLRIQRVAVEHGMVLKDATAYNVNPWGERRQYVDEVRTLNREIRAALENILRSADRPVVVILQGDHGPASLGEWRQPSDAFLRERLAIFNAYLVPRDVQEAVYPSITPVNSFRAVFSRYFGSISRGFPIAATSPTTTSRSRSST